MSTASKTAVATAVSASLANGRGTSEELLALLEEIAGVAEVYADEGQIGEILAEAERG